MSMKTIRFLWMALTAYRKAEVGGEIHYMGLSQNGVCQCAVFVAVGREAWRVSQFAIENYKIIKGEDYNIQ